MPHRVAGAALAAIGLAACQSTAWNHRYGPDPQISPTAVAVSIDAQHRYMQAFLDLGAIGQSQASWYTATLAGFNYVDEVCDQYLIALFKIDRRRDLSSRGIGLAGAAAATILGAYDADPADIAAVAAAFGFGSSFADAIGDKYVFADKPELIYGTVEKLRREKRRLVSQHRSEIDSEPAAYAEIRSYLALCLPPVIDAHITKVIVQAEAKPDDGRTERTVTATPRATQTTDVILE